MRDKRSPEELSVEELERLLAQKRLEARQAAQNRAQRSGRGVVEIDGEGDYAPESPANTGKTVPALEALLQQTQGDMPAPLMAAGMSSTAVAREAAFEEAPPPPPRPRAPRPGATAAQVQASAPAKPRKKRSRWYDALLTLIEIAAVLGLVLIGYQLFTQTRTLEQETANAQELFEEQRRAGIPTLQPTPSLSLENAVLPGGHIVTESGQLLFNYDEVPAHLLPLVESQWIRPVVARPQPTNETAVSLIIPRLEINQTIVQGVDLEALRQGVGQLVNGADPGDDVGNVVLAAHNDVYGELFRHLDQLQAGDNFQIQTQTTTYTYEITDIFTVAPNDVSVLATRGGATATLISCYPYRVNTERIIVYANRIA
ncbi:MAG: sortase [Pleurocapsa minor GSE-CHR-MK-17-07R]|nr:sortase [Pleurocapsa minor GSE-CHR-MK 17-07R]